MAARGRWKGRLVPVGRGISPTDSGLAGVVHHGLAERLGPRRGKSYLGLGSFPLSNNNTDPRRFLHQYPRRMDTSRWLFGQKVWSLYLVVGQQTSLPLPTLVFGMLPRQRCTKTKWGRGGRGREGGDVFFWAALFSSMTEALGGGCVQFIFFTPFPPPPFFSGMYCLPGCFFSPTHGHICVCGARGEEKETRSEHTLC